MIWVDRDLEQNVLQIEIDFYVDLNASIQSILKSRTFGQECTPVCRCDGNFNNLLKVSKFQNELIKSSFLLKYEPKVVRISAIVMWHSTGQKSLQYFVHIVGETITS